MLSSCASIQKIASWGYNYGCAIRRINPRRGMLPLHVVERAGARKLLGSFTKAAPYWYMIEALIAQSYNSTVAQGRIDMTQRIRILIVDDQTLVREGFRKLLELEPNFEV